MSISLYQKNRQLNYYFGNRSSGNISESLYYIGFVTTDSILESWNGTTLMEYEPRLIGTEPKTNYSRISVPNTEMG